MAFLPGNVHLSKDLVELRGGGGLHRTSFS